MHFLEKRDFDFDMVRAFLVISMIFGHVFRQFYIIDYNWNIASYIMIGFVFLAGFVLGVRDTGSLNKFTIDIFTQRTAISIKLVFLYIICNIAILLYFPERADKIKDLNLVEIVLSSVIGSQQRIFGFDVLIPIALVIVLSSLILPFAGKKMAFPAALFLYALLVYIEISKTDFLNYYGIKLLVIGLIGTFMGKIIYFLDWNKLIQQLSKFYALMISGLFIVLYYLFIATFTTNKERLPFFILIISTIIILLFIYMLSKEIKLNQYKSLKLICLPLSNYMLFAYIFHILVINILFVLIKRHGQTISSCIFIGFFVMMVTLGASKIIDYITKRSLVARNVYSLLFR